MSATQKGESMTCVSHDVSLDGDSLQVRLDGAVPEHVAWTPLPHIRPVGGSFVRLGVAEQGWLFADLAATPELLALAGEPSRVAKLAGSIVFQAACLDEADRPRILLNGTVVPRLRPGLGVHRFGTLEECCRARAAGLAVASEPAKFELVVTTPAELTRPGTLEAVRAGGPAVLLTVGEMPDADWRIVT